MTKRSRHINVESEITIQLLKVRNELTNKIHRASRQPCLGGDRRVVGKSSTPGNFRNVERHTGGYFQWLNSRLLELSLSRQPLLRPFDRPGPSPPPPFAPTIN